MLKKKRKKTDEKTNYFVLFQLFLRFCETLYQFGWIEEKQSNHLYTIQYNCFILTSSYDHIIVHIRIQCNRSLMLISNMLQHLFDVSVAIWAVRNLLTANWVGVCATALCAIGLYGRSVWAIGLKFSAFVKNRLGYKLTSTAIFFQFFFAYTVTITDHFGPNYVRRKSEKWDSRGKYNKYPRFWEMYRKYFEMSFRKIRYTRMKSAWIIEVSTYEENWFWENLGLLRKFMRCK